MVTSDGVVQPGKVDWQGELLHPSVPSPEPQMLWGGDVGIPIQQDNPNPVASRSQGFPCPHFPNQVLSSSYRTLLTVFAVGSRGWWLGTDSWDTSRSSELILWLALEPFGALSSCEGCRCYQQLVPAVGLTLSD